MVDHRSGLDSFEGPESLRSLSSNEPLLSLRQLVNRLGSTRGGGELYMQSPALRARDQHHREQLVAAVEGRLYVCAVSLTHKFFSHKLEPPLVWKEPGGIETIIAVSRRRGLASQGGERWRLKVREAVHEVRGGSCRVMYAAASAGRP